MLDGVIYKIEICNEFYIGSTIETLKERQRKHNISLKKKTYKLYETCKANDITNITLIEIEKVKVNNKLELKIIEQEYINKLEPTLNTIKAYRTEEEIKNRNKISRKIYMENNKLKINEKTKEYYEINKLKLKEKRKEKIKCEFCEKEMTQGCLTRHKKRNCKKVIN